MKLYKTPRAVAGQRWHSAKTGLKDYIEVETPKDGRAGMATWLNNHELEVSNGIVSATMVDGCNTPLDELEAAELRAVAAATTMSAPSAAVTHTAIMEFILDHASVAQVEAIFAALGTRFKEVTRGQ